jgi:hypothetical protein
MDEPKESIEKEHAKPISSSNNRNFNKDHHLLKWSSKSA